MASVPAGCRAWPRLRAGLTDHETRYHHRGRAQADFPAHQGRTGDQESAGREAGRPGAKGIQNRDEARQRAELLRPVLAELAGMTARAIARELNGRKVPLPGRGPWHAMTVIRVQRRLKGK